ncbi:MAG: serine/threonine-protein phosphatase, partial [Planctomycetes bacterium]|nr:serine/threonine-protein phosphatase [Planctomycetota bacterium]
MIASNAAKPARGTCVQMLEDALALHQADNRAALRKALGGAFTHMLGDTSAAVLLAQGPGDPTRVEYVYGSGFSFSAGSCIDSAKAQQCAEVVMPLLIGTVEYGWVVFDRLLDSEVTWQLESLLRHYSAGLANAVRLEEAQRTGDLLYSSLHALEDGVVLFQIQDMETAAARFLQLCLQAFGSRAGALYLLDNVDDPNSGLRLNQTLGLPDEMLGRLVCSVDDQPWASKLLTRPLTLLQRTESGVFPELRNDLLPDVLETVVGAPLRYHGVVAGVCVLLNVDPGLVQKGSLGTNNHLLELGAAVFHRLHLQDVAVRNQSIHTQLEIASVIQAGFLPEKRLRCDIADVAWHSEMSAWVGGDYLDILQIGGELVATVSDVSGHGIDSALLMSSFRAAYRARANDHAPSDLLELLNETVASEVGDTGMFLTSVVVRIAADGRSLRLASAGHNDVYMYRAATGEIEVIESSGPSLGFFPRASFDEYDFTVASGDVLLLYTDGVVEAAAPGPPGSSDRGELFGDDEA